MATLTPQETVTFTITKVPARPAQRKTIQRLMRLQPEIQKGLKALQKRRRQHDNNTYIRAGVRWTDRAKATKLTRVDVGETFTLRITPHIVPDIESVQQFLKY
ncbi:MAG: hypothetical protein ACYTGP_00795 [Planctomycetota bacterium]|jgi:hypothetical protein